MPFKIVRNDITKMQVDAIVNTANMEPIYSDGVDTAVYEAAGTEQLLAARRKIGYMDEGEVAITPGFNLPAKYIIHAVSPYYEDGESGEEELLRSCYRESLKLAYENHCESIAFPLISTGSFGYPKDEGLRIAMDEINAFLLKHDMLIYIAVFDPESTKLANKLYPDLRAYIDQNYVDEKTEQEYGEDSHISLLNIIPDFLRRSVPAEGCRPFIREMNIDDSKDFADSDYDEDDEDLEECEDFDGDVRYESDEYYGDEEICLDKCVMRSLKPPKASLSDRMLNMSYTFQEYLFELIETRGMTNAEVYNRGAVTKQLFSKIKLNPDYHPDKATVLRLCIGAKLNIEQAKELMARAGYAFSPCDKRDIIFMYFIENEIYDMIEVAIVLEKYNLPCFIE